MTLIRPPALFVLPSPVLYSPFLVPPSTSSALCRRRATPRLTPFAPLAPATCSTATLQDAADAPGSADPAAPGPPVSRTRKRRRPTQLRHLAGPDARPISEVRDRDELEGTVTAVGPADSAWIDVNVRSPRGYCVYGRVRLANVDERTASKKLVVGKSVRVHVHRVQPASGRLELGLGRPPRLAPPTMRLNAVGPDAPHLSDLAQGQRMDGRVVSCGSYGLVVDVAVCRTGRHGRRQPFPALLPRRHFAPGWVLANDTLRPQEVTRELTPGDLLQVWVRKLRVEPPYLIVDGVELSEERLAEEQAELGTKSRSYRKRNRSTSSLVVGQVRRGLVCKIVAYGAFVNLGTRQNALLHATAFPVQFDWRQSLNIGDIVYTRIIKNDQNSEDKNDGLGVSFVMAPALELDRLKQIAQKPTATQADIDDLAAITRAERVLNGAVGGYVDMDGLGLKFATLPKQKRSDAQNLEGNNDEQGKKESTDNKQTEVQAKEVTKNEDEVSRVEMQEVMELDDDDYADSDDEDDEDDEDQEQFSDDYFEDKYGY